MVGDEVVIILMVENVIKIIVLIQMCWKFGQYIYFCMFGILFFENYFFMIVLFCSEDFFLEYGEKYRDL